MTDPTRVRCGACGHWQSDHRDGHGACVEDDEAAMGGCGCEAFTTVNPYHEKVVAWARPRDLFPRWVTATASESHRTITVRVDRADDYYTVPLVAVRVKDTLSNEEP